MYQRHGTGDASNHCGKSVPAAQHRRFEVMLKRAENRVCFDCGARQPRWASTNLGIFFCLRCAGIHRSLGVHISKVKSTNMDAWEESMIDFIEHVGNGRGRLLYEYNMSEASKPRPSSDTSVVERVLRAKYEKKEYYNPRFQELLAEFMQTPISDGESRLNDAAVAAKAAEEEAQRLRQQQQIEAQQLAEAQRARAAAAAQLEELWGGPVATAAPPPPPPSIRDEVAELFAAPVLAGTAPRQSSSNPFWGMAAPQQQQQQLPHNVPGLSGAVSNSSAIANGQQSSSPLVDLFTSQTSAQTASSSMSTSRQSSGFPGQQQNATNAYSVSIPAGGKGGGGGRGRGNADDDLFGGPQSSSTHGVKDEVLSLFSSSQPVGSYGGGGGPYGQQQQQHPHQASSNVAWQPHVVRPYYHPEK